MQALSLTPIRANIGTVFQDTFLSNTSLLENIAYPNAPTQLNGAAVDSPIHAAQMNPFIATLPNHLQTTVGERSQTLRQGRTTIIIAHRLTTLTHHEADLEKRRP